MAILNMYKVFPEKKYLEMAISIGDSLIEKQEKNGGWKGKTSANELAGFSHGASGISYALYRLWHLTKEKNIVYRLKGVFYLRIPYMMLKKETGKIKDVLKISSSVITRNL